MTEQFLADTVDSSGHAHPTVGENIRKGSKDPTIIGAFTHDTDKAKMTNALDADPLTSEQVTKNQNVSWNCVGD